MSTHRVHVFISHSWSYSGHYDRLASWIFDYDWRFGQAVAKFRNYSVPRNDPIVGAPTQRALRAAIHRQIARSHVVVIPTGMYAHHSRWIAKEIVGAKIYRKKILAVDLRGAQRSASFVWEAADRGVGWNSNSVVSAIWDLYYRG